jgi:hypothetical protein
MTWEFYVETMTRERFFSRVLQILETQMVDISSIAGGLSDKISWVRFVISAREDKAYRIKALLYRILGVVSVTVLIGPSGLEKLQDDVGVQSD